MTDTIVMFMDESCHIQNDKTDTMSMVTVYTLKANNDFYELKISKIKDKYKIGGELKWSKLSNSNFNLYKEVISFIASEHSSNNLRIRALLVDRNKESIIGDYSSWYYKMVYLLFNKIISEDFFYSTRIDSFFLYLDFKDIKSKSETNKTADFLQKKIKNKSTIKGQAVDSKDFVLIQIADIIAGALTYKKRGLKTSQAKINLIAHIEKEFNINLSKTTPKSKLDFNLLVWRGNTRDEKNKFLY